MSVTNYYGAIFLRRSCILQEIESDLVAVCNRRSQNGYYFRISSR
uniref:Uncharacterized protein n=1 Tax=uncultured alpha proteobacterium HF0130_20P23 TaxID=710809 RepID=E0XT96_9PROT|nr:hypothetical protein [uncultured alpha proteobacterium HF0130_20P23]